MEKERKSYTFEEIKQKMMNFCVYQDRCHFEVEQKMKDFLLIPEAKDEILMYLMQENYLNEERFTRSYIRGKFSIKRWGKVKIKMNLRQKGISDKLIDKCFDEIDEFDYELVIRNLFDSYIDKISSGNNFTKNSKTIKYLMSRGFEYENIKSVMNSSE